MKYYFHYFSLLITVFCSVRLQAQDQSPVKKKLTISPLPALFYQPETRLGYGALAIGVFNLGKDSLTRASSAQTLLAYTLNKQLIFENTYNLFLPDEKYVFTGEASGYDFPINYYGVGNYTPDAPATDSIEISQVGINYKLLYFHNRALKKVRKSLFIGFQQRFTYLFDLEWNPDSRILERPASELDKVTTSGLGFAVLYDSRNSAINAQKGRYAEISSLHHAGLLGSEFNFSRYFADFRAYFPLRNTTVLATQVLGNFSSGAPPFREMGLLGGQNMMRGYYKGRFRDRQYLAAQAEVRQHLFWRIGVVAFVAAGEVANSPQDFEIAGLKYTAGAGLRVLLNRKDRVNIRIDYGTGKNTSGLYFGIAEAF